MSLVNTTPDLFIEAEGLAEYASRLSAKQLSDLGELSGYMPTEFFSVKFMGVDPSFSAKFLTLSYDDNEDEYIVGGVEVNNRGLDFEPNPRFTSQDEVEASDFFEKASAKK